MSYSMGAAGVASAAIGVVLCKQKKKEKKINVHVH